MRKQMYFDYFKVYKSYYNEQKNVYVNKPVDISKLLTDLDGITTGKRVYSTGEDKARVQSIEFINDRFNMHFIRIRKNEFPLRTHDDGTYSHFEDMEEEEGFGEEISAIFYPKTKVFMIRRNVRSLAPLSIAQYFTELIGLDNYQLTFKPLIHKKAFDLLKKDHLIRSAEVSVADVKSAKDQTKRAIGSIAKRAEEAEAPMVATFKIGFSKKGSKKSSNAPIYEEVKQLMEDPNTKKLIVNRKVDENTNAEPIDLIEHRLREKISFNDKDYNETSRNILHSTIVEKMHEKYKKREQEIIDHFS